MSWGGNHYKYNRRNARCLIIIKELIDKKQPSYLYKILEPILSTTNTRHKNIGLIRNFPCRLIKYSKSFFPHSIRLWNSLDTETKCLPLKSFKNKLFKQIRPKMKLINTKLDNTGSMFLTWLRLGLSPLKHHKFNYNFPDAPDPFCSCFEGIEDTAHFLLFCKMFSNARDALFSNVNNFIPNFENMSDKKKVNILLFGANFLKQNENQKIIQFTIDYVKDTNRFNFC